MSIENEQQFIKWEASSRDTIDVKRAYIDMADDLAGGVWLSQLVYFFLPVKNDDGSFRRHSRLVFMDGEWWLPINGAEWWEQCRIKRKQYQNFANLYGQEQKGTNLLEAPEGSRQYFIHRNTFYKNKKTPFLRINWPRFLEDLNTFTNNYSLSSNQNPPSPDRGDNGASYDSPDLGQSVVYPEIAAKIGGNRPVLGQSVSPKTAQPIVPKVTQPIVPKRDNYNVKEVFKENNQENNKQQAHEIENQMPVVDVVDVVEFSNLLTANNKLSNKTSLDNAVSTYWPNPVPETTSDSELMQIFAKLPSAIRKASESHLVEIQPQLKPSLKNAAAMEPYRIGLMRTDWPQKLHELSTQLVAVKTKDGRGSGMTMENLAPLVAADFEIAERFLKWFPHYDNIETPAKALHSMLTHPEKWPEPESFTKARDAAEQAKLQAAAKQRADELKAQFDKEEAQQRASKAQNEEHERRLLIEIAAQFVALPIEQQNQMTAKLQGTPKFGFIFDKVRAAGGIEKTAPHSLLWFDFYRGIREIGISIWGDIDVPSAAQSASQSSANTPDKEHQGSQQETHQEETHQEVRAFVSHITAPPDLKRAVASILGYVVTGTYEASDLDDHATELCEKFDLDESQWQQVKNDVLTRLSRKAA